MALFGFEYSAKCGLSAWHFKVLWGTLVVLIVDAHLFAHHTSFDLSSVSAVGSETNIYTNTLYGITILIILNVATV